MAITSSTTFDIVRIQCSCQHLTIFSVTPWDGDAYATDAEGIDPATTDAAQVAQLDIMRDAVVDGTAEVIYWDGANLIDYEDLPFQYAMMHLLHDIHPVGGRGQVLARQILAQRSSLDSDTGRAIITGQHDDIPEKRIPDGATYDYSLGSWSVAIWDDRLIFSHTWEDADEVAQTDLNTQDPIRAMLGKLESIRVSGSGSAVGSDVNTQADLASSIESRTFRLDQPGGADELDLRYQSNTAVISNHPGTTDVGLFSFTLEKASGESGTVNITAMRRWLRDETQALTVAGVALEEPVRGSLDISHKARRIILPGDLELIAHQGEPAWRHPTLGLHFFSSSPNRSVRYADLVRLQSNNLSRFMPNRPALIHFGHNESGSGVLTFRSITTHITSDGRDGIWKVHNVSDQHSVSIRHSNSTTATLITLGPGQRADFLLNIESNGEAGAVVVENPPSRNLIINVDRSQTTNRDLDTGAVTASGTHYRSLPYPSGGPDFIDDDGFTLPAVSTPYLNQAITVATFNGRGVIQIKHPGILTTTIAYLLEFDGDPGGSIGAYNGPALLVREADSGTPSLPSGGNQAIDPMSGDDAMKQYDHVYRGRHTADTKLVWTHRIKTASTTITDSEWEDVSIDNMRITMELTPEIRHVYSI